MLMWQIIFLTAALWLAGCAAPSGDDGGARRDYLWLADQDDVPTLDPARGYDTTSWQFEEMLFNTLVDYDDAGNLVPELAERWDVDAAQRVYTFAVRPGVRFSNGRALTANDLRYSIERVLQPATRSPGAEFFRGVVGAAACEATTCRVAGITTPDAQTIRFELTEHDPLFLHKLAMPFAAAVPAEAVDRWGEDFARHPVGSGPFLLREWLTGQRVVLERNPDYFVPGVPRLPGIVRLVGVNSDLAWLKYEAGQLDVASIPPAEFPRVVRSPAYRAQLRQVTTMRTSYLGMNTAAPPFTDRRVRQAVNYAVNKAKLLRLINDRGVVARGVLPPNMPGYNSDLRGYPFAPGDARRLLASAGYGNGFTTTLWVRSDETALRLAQSVQQDLADVGIAVRIKAIAWGPFLEAVRTPNLVPFFSLGWEADFPDPSNFLEVLLHSRAIGTNNNTNYRNPEVDALLDTAAHSLDAGARLAALRRAEELVVADAPWVFLYHPVSYAIVSARVRDFVLHPLRPPRLEHVWLAGDGDAPGSSDASAARRARPAPARPALAS
jgi:ABC-type transport system substrate-binding protein